MTELLGVEIPLGVAGVGGKPDPWACSGHRCKLEVMCASGWVGVCVSLVPMGVPVTWGVAKDFVASVVLLNVSELQCFLVCPIAWELIFLCDPVFL